MPFLYLLIQSINCVEQLKEIEDIEKGGFRGFHFFCNTKVSLIWEFKNYIGGGFI